MTGVVLNRRKNNLISSWWWTVDRVALFAIAMIIAFGTVMVMAASPAVAEKINLGPFYFVKRQMVFLLVAVATIFFTSLLDPRSIRRLAVLGFAVGMVLLVVVLLTGEEAKGAKRWIYILGFSLQPSEFIKPLFIVVTAWMLAENKKDREFAGFKISTFLYGVLVFLLVLQPDIGMIIIISAVWLGQLFLAGLPINIIAIFVTVAFFGLLAAYNFLPHVAYRVDSFLASFDGGGNFQVRKSLEAFHAGGIFGVGPGEGIVKQHLPDSHTDFIFAVAGEELGAMVCIVIVFLYALIVIRGLKRMLEEKDLFIIYAVSGLLMQFGIQAIINMGVSLNLMPTKGMTLPFISYGGSSMLAISLAMGMMLALTRRKYGVVLGRPKIIV